MEHFFLNLVCQLKCIVNISTLGKAKELNAHNLADEFLQSLAEGGTAESCSGLGGRR